MINFRLVVALIAARLARRFMRWHLLCLAWPFLSTRLYLVGRWLLQFAVANRNVLDFK